MPVIALVAYFDVWWLYPPAIFIIAARQHALGIIMHDATHYRLFTSRTTVCLPVIPITGRAESSGVIASS